MKRIAAVLASWGPSGVFLLALIDSSGIPLPAGVDLLLTTTAAVNPEAAYLSAALATAGSLIGSFILFSIARKGGELYLAKHINSPWALRFQEWFSRYGMITVFVPMVVPFVPLPAKIFILSAGALGVRPWQFLLTVAAARIPRYFGLAYLGAHLGAGAGDWARAHVWQMLGGAVALVAVLLVTMRVMGAKQQPADLQS